jgi:hypothetical protein
VILEKYHIDSSFLEKYNIKLSPQELLWALDRGFIRPKTIVDYAVDRLIYPQNEDGLYNISLLNKDERYQVRENLEDYLQNQVVKGNPLISEDELSEKWLYLLLKWLYENKYRFDDPLGIVEEIYADFDYPAEIEGFIRYMPIDNSNEELYDSIDQPIKNSERLMKKWLIFLQAKDTKFCPEPH